VPDGVADVAVAPLVEPALRRRLLAVARASVAARPVVAEVLDALAQACKS
jgi:hypothetical protein